MKKSLLALAVAALAAASTVSATTVYDKDGTSLGFHGRVQSVFYSGNQSGVTDEKATIKTSGRLGIDLRSQITSGAAAFAMAEWDMADKEGNTGGFGLRYMWAGVDFGQYGNVKVGRFEPAGKFGLFATDIFDDYGCYGYSGNDDKRDGTVQYQWSGNGFDVLVSYSFAKDGTQVDGAYLKGESIDTKYDVGIGLGYTTQDILFGPITVRAGFTKGDFNSVKNAAGNDYNNSVVLAQVANVGTLKGYYDSYTSYAIGVSWGKLNIGPYVGLQYSQRKLDGNSYLVKSGANGATELVSGESGDAKVRGYEFAVGYSFANGVTVRTGYQTQKYEDFFGDDAKSATVPVYANWQLTPAFQIWAEARFDAGTDDSNDGGKNFADITSFTKGDGSRGDVYGDLSENVYSFGMRYNF